MPLDAIETDTTHWPIVIHRTIGIPADEQVDAFIRRADAILARREAHVVIFDSSQAGRVSSYMRQRSSEWLKANGQSLSEHCLGTGLVFRSAALRFVMSTVMLVTPHPVPHSVCASVDEAMRWARGQLAGPRKRASAG